jgi:capsular polysaccharide biosynthesis protein
MDNQVVKTSGSKKSIFSVLYKNLLLIILATVLGALAGFGWGIISVDPVYSEGVSLMFIAEVTSEDENASNSQDMVLSQYWLADVNKILTSPSFVKIANDYYNDNGGEGSITTGGIKVSYNSEQSLIFSITYTDVSPELASKKLSAIVEKAKGHLQDKLVAKNVELKETSNINFKGMNYDYTSYIIIGLVIGLLVSAGFVAIRFLLDNTIKDKHELEEMTGVNVLACIDSFDKHDKKHNNQKTEEITIK